MLVSLFTASFGYRGAAIAMILLTVSTMIIELLWLRVVFARFPILHTPSRSRLGAIKSLVGESEHDPLLDGREPEVMGFAFGVGKGALESESESNESKGLIGALKAEWDSWSEFMSMPIFLSKYICLMMY